MWFTTKEFKYIELHCLVDDPKSYVIVASGIILELTSAVNFTESVSWSPMYKWPPIVTSFFTTKDPDTLTDEPDPNRGVKLFTLILLIIFLF